MKKSIHTSIWNSTLSKKPRINIMTIFNSLSWWMMTLEYLISTSTKESNIRHKMIKAVTWCENQFSQSKNLIKVFHASTFTFPNMKRSNSDKCPQLQGLSTATKADLNYGFLVPSHLNKSILLVLPQERREKTALEESPPVTWSKTTLQNIQVNYHKNKSTLLESTKMYGS